LAEPSDRQSERLATTVDDVSRRVSLLVREEIELAKAEVTAKLTKLARGAAVAAAAGVFVLLALMFALHGVAWLLFYVLPGNSLTFFWGFFALAIILLLVGALAGFLAYRALRKATPPTPQMAIDEARKIRTTVTSSTSSSGGQ